METTMRSRQDAPEALFALTATDIDRVRWQAVTGCPGVRAKELWRRGDLVDAMIAYEAGARTPGVAHRAAHHHIWVVSGRATVAGRGVSAGGYVYVPPGVGHPIEAGAEGCVLLQMHRPFMPDQVMS